MERQSKKNTNFIRVNEPPTYENLHQHYFTLFFFGDNIN